MCQRRQRRAAAKRLSGLRAQPAGESKGEGHGTQAHAVMPSHENANSSCVRVGCAPPLCPKSETMSGLMTETYLAERVKRGSRRRVATVLAKIPDLEHRTY